MKKLVWDSKAKPFLEPVVIGSICSLMIRKYISFLRSETFEMEVQRTDDWIQVRQTLSALDNSSSCVVEVVFPFEEGSGADNDQIVACEMVDLVVDYLDNYWKEYLTDDRDTFLSLDWSSHTWEGKSFYIRGSQHNVALERMADDFLAKHGMGGFDIAPLSMET